jgi:lipid-A-disaccharide synthase
MNNEYPYPDHDKPLIIYIIAGEASGDLLGADLMRSLRAKSKREIIFYGIGGDKMEAEGLSSLFPYHELSMMGLVEILPYMYRTLVHISSTVEDIVSKQPDMIITIDSPGFCFRVVEKLKKDQFNAKFVHYVAPSVWAYKPGRAKKCAELFDHMLALLPFEPPYFEKYGLGCTFTGHPVVATPKPGNAGEFREKYELPDNIPLFCLLPGSRKGEVKLHMPVFTRAISMLSSCYPNLALAIAVPEHVLPLLGPYLNNCPFRVIIAEDEEDKKNAIAASNFAFVKSGTVAFEVAAAGVPMLITYRMNKLSVWWLRRMITTKYANLINILLKKEAIPELLQERSHPLMLASCANMLLRKPALIQQQQADIREALAKLLPPDGKQPGDIAAEKILSLL